MMTQSVGVPLTAKRRSPTGRSRSGIDERKRMRDARLVVFGRHDPDVVGERTRDLGAGVEPIRVNASSLVTRMRISCFLARRRGCPAAQRSLRNLRKIDCVPGMTEQAERPRSCGTLDGLEAAHIALQHIGHRDRAILLLIGLEHGDQRAADRDA